MTSDGIAEALENSVLNQPVVNRTSIFSAVQEQPGLVLTAGKTPMRMLVIDGAQRPDGD
jgi:uncharacterized protein (TIGR03435 family)